MVSSQLHKIHQQWLQLLLLWKTLVLKHYAKNSAKSGISPEVHVLPLSGYITWHCHFWLANPRKWIFNTAYHFRFRYLSLWRLLLQIIEFTGSNNFPGNDFYTLFLKHCNCFCEMTIIILKNKIQLSAVIYVLVKPYMRNVLIDVCIHIL